MDTDEQQIRHLEKKRCEALMAGDIAGLTSLLADDLIHIHGSGVVEGLAAYLKGIETRLIFHRVERGTLDIRIHGDTALVVGPLDQVIEVRGDDKRNQISALVSQTWIRVGGGWKQNSCHMHFLSVA